MKKYKYIKFFSELGIKDVPEVGGKNASLGEMYRALAKDGILVPNGFATTASAYRYFLRSAKLQTPIRKLLQGLDTHNVPDLMRRGKAIRELILGAKLPDDFVEEIVSAYKELSASYKQKSIDVAVRSSATAEDLPDASFAGQQESFLNINGQKNLVETIQKCIASLFTNRAISYRVDKKFNHFSVALSVGVQKMIRADIGSSGVMFTIDTESGFKDAMLINSTYGLGENIVQGKVNPDEFYFFKPTGTIISKNVGDKKIKMVYNRKGKNPVKNVPVPLKDQLKLSVSDKDILKLAKWGMIIEKHYKGPMDIEWAVDGLDKKLYILQARPETVQSQIKGNFIERYKLVKKGKVLCFGQSVGAKIGSGVSHRIMSVKEINKFKPGQVLVTSMTDPDWEPIMKMASAIVTDQGGRTCHAAIVSRELGIPCIVGTKDGTRKIKNNKKITVNCAEGEVGYVYEGIIEHKVERINVGTVKNPKTKIMLNIGEPDKAFLNSFIPNDGVGLARLEFIINNYIKIHPLALINYNKIESARTKQRIDKLTKTYVNKKQYFVDRLAQGMSMIAAAFYPKEVIFRLSDFKSNEYANLIGGDQFEPEEANPMIGYRGASRYYSPSFLPAFKLECQAIKMLRDKMKLNNVKVMVPFCRTVEEGEEVIKIMAQNGLKQGDNGLEIYVMAELPSNVILADQFSKVFDGFSIGSNDLTQLALGIDRDSGGTLEIKGNSDERNEAVKILLADMIKKAKRNKKKVGICGQGPSDFPELAKFLVEQGIDSLSLTPDSAVDTRIAVYELEKKLKRKKGLLGMFF